MVFCCLSSSLASCVVVSPWIKHLHFTSRPPHFFILCKILTSAFFTYYINWNYKLSRLFHFILHKMASDFPFQSLIATVYIYIYIYICVCSSSKSSVIQTLFTLLFINNQFLSLAAITPSADWGRARWITQSERQCSSVSQSQRHWQSFKYALLSLAVSCRFS